MVKQLTQVLLVIGWCVVFGVQSVQAGFFEDYQRDLDIYRVVHDDYVVKKNQYSQIQTFAVEEELITTARQMLLTRADVWISYWQLLSDKINALQDFPEGRKKTWLKKFSEEIDFLNQHKERLVQAKTRSSLLQEAVVLNGLLEPYNEMAFSANSQITVTAMSQAARHLLNFNTELNKRVNEQQLTALEKETKTRGLAVHNDRVSSLMDQLQKLQTRFDESSGYATAESFAKISRELDPAYTTLLQQSRIVVELSEGVEW